MSNPMFDRSELFSVEEYQPTLPSPWTGYDGLARDLSIDGDGGKAYLSDGIVGIQFNGLMIVLFPDGTYALCDTSGG